MLQSFTDVSSNPPKWPKFNRSFPKRDEDSSFQYLAAVNPLNFVLSPLDRSVCAITGTSSYRHQSYKSPRTWSRRSPRNLTVFRAMEAQRQLERFPMAIPEIWRY